MDFYDYFTSLTSQSIPSTRFKAAASLESERNDSYIIESNWNWTSFSSLPCGEKDLKPFLVDVLYFFLGYFLTSSNQYFISFHFLIVSNHFCWGFFLLWLFLPTDFRFSAIDIDLWRREINFGFDHDIKTIYIKTTPYRQVTLELLYQSIKLRNVKFLSFGINHFCFFINSAYAY